MDSSDSFRSKGRDLLGVVADSGQVARLAAGSGADFLLALSAGAYRSQGLSALAAFLPFRNGNDLAESLLVEQVLPGAGAVPVFVGLLPVDPTTPIGDRLDRVAASGASGVLNYPSTTLLDGSMRGIFESEGATIESEIAMLGEARRRGLSTIAFVGDEPESAARFASSGVSALILTPGLTQALPEGHARRDRLQQATRRLVAGREAARKAGPDCPCLIYGGPIARPEDLEEVYRQAAFDGFVGGSVFGRFPIEGAVSATIRRFQGVVSRPEGARTPGLGPMIGETGAMRDLFRLLKRAAASDLNVCIEGESGVGKELVATHIHTLSARAPGAFVTLNCGAIPDPLLESELFGHERGAFTGADHRRLGKFELAHDGTLLLDEVGDLSPRGQVALLRVLQQREATRVGGNRPIAVNVRVLAASNQPLSGLVEQGRFRADLYYRLNNLTLRVPPLRDRLDDIPALVEPILATLRAQMNRELAGLAPEFLARLRAHAWPGNLRELQHVIAQAALLEDGPILLGSHFSPSTATTRALLGLVAADGRSARRRRARQALIDAGGNKSRAAEILKVSRKTLYQWLRDEEVG